MVLNIGYNAFFIGSHLLKVGRSVPNYYFSYALGLTVTLIKPPLVLGDKNGVFQ